MRKIGTKRSDAVVAKIFLTAPLGPSYGSMGYFNDLSYFQGEESYFKLGRLLANGSITQEQHDRIKETLAADDAAFEEVE